MVTTVIRGREGYEWLELAGGRKPPIAASAMQTRTAPVMGLDFDAGEVGRYIKETAPSLCEQTLREATDPIARGILGYAQRDIAAGEVIAVALGGGSTPDAGPSACIMPPGWLDASSGAWLDVAAEQFYNIKRDPGETCDALRTRLRAEQRKRDAAAVEEDRDRGTEPWLRRRLGALLGVEPSAFGIESVEVGVVLVTAWHSGVTVPALNAALAKLEEELPLGVRLEAAPVRVTNPVPLVTPGPAVHRSDEPQGIPIATPAEHIDLLDAMARRPSPPADDAERARRFFAGEGERTTRVNQWQGARHFWERGAR